MSTSTSTPADGEAVAKTGPSLLVIAVRRWLPLALIIAGLVIVIAGGAHEHALQVGIPIFSAGASIWFLNFMVRLGIKGDQERDTEEEARAFFAAHGRWPDEHKQQA